jgi:U3 small nucleolar RNA-associated protein 6
MAESVQKFIESTIPELKDLQKRKIFSEIEIKAIVKKRTDFEYGVRRRCAKKVDFLRYIEYELSLNQLRLKRKQRLQIHSQAIKGGAASEYSMVRRVHHIFDRLSRKFPGDLGVWMEYLRFARRANSSQKLAKIFLRALQLHPRCPELWVLSYLSISSI